MPSAKTEVIEHLFFERWDNESRELSDHVVTMDQVLAAMDAVDSSLSRRNPANFFKDVVRTGNRNSIFPQSVVEKGYTAEQAAGRGGQGVFEFVRLPEGQETAFVDLEPRPDAREAPFVAQSLSLPVEARRLARGDESWLTQVVANLFLVEQHFALNSTHRMESVEHLMNHVKLGEAEIDALWLGKTLGTTESEGSQVLIPVEMKREAEVLEPEQLSRAAAAAQRVAIERLGPDSIVVPLGAKVLESGLIWIAEFEHLSEGERTRVGRTAETVFELRPAVPGF